MPADLPPLPISIPNLTATQITALLVPLVAVLPYIISNTFPSPTKIVIHPSIGTIKIQSAARRRLQQLYPEDIYGEGGYARLPLGAVKYWMVGPEDGVKIVLICGMSVPALIWNDTVPYLAKAGFRVLLFDLYGRGYSEAPEVVYNDNLFITQLALLLQYLKWDKPYFAGGSLGGGILAAFAAKFPHLVGDRLAFLAPAGVMKESDLSARHRLMFSPLVQYLYSLPGVKSVIESRIASIPSITTTVGVLDEVVRLQQLVLPGYVKAVTSSIWEGPIREQQASYSAIGASGRKVLMIWGSNDVVVPYRLNEELKTRMPQVKLVTISGGGHEITSERAAEVGPALVEFFTTR